MSSELTQAKQIKPYGMRIISPERYDENTMIDVTESVENSRTNVEHVVINGSTTTLEDLSNYADISAIEASGTFLTDSTYGISWGQHIESDTSLDLIIDDVNISEVQFTISGILNSNSLGWMHILIYNADEEYISSSTIRDAWAADSVGQTYVRDDILIQSQSAINIINDTIIVKDINITKIVVGIYYMPGYSKSPRWINYLKYITSTIKDVEINTTHIHDIFEDNSILATYRFNGDTKDIGGNYNGTNNGVTFNSGKFGEAGTFNGVDSNIDIENNSKFNVNTTGAITISGWTKLDNFTIESYLFSTNSNSNTTYSYYLGINNTSKVALCGHCNGTNWSNAHGTTVIKPNTWYFLTGIIVNGGGISIYLNGKLEGTATAQPTTNNVIDVCIGRSREYYLDGKIDQLRVFNRALTKDEVLTLYNEREDYKCVIPMQ